MRIISVGLGLKRLSGDEVVAAEDFADFLKGFSDLLAGVSGHEAETDEGVLRRNGGRDDGVDKDAFFEEFTGDLECQHVVADVEGNDGRRCVADLKSELLEAVEGIVGEFPQVVLTIGLFLHDFESCKGGGCRCGSD